ncbi:MAG TPA: OsmC family protein [Anaerolineae bacterium]|jgi:putative redox protein
MATTNVSARWTGEALNYVGTDTKGNQIPIGGKNVSPGQMLLLALASCTGMDIVSILQKKRQQVTDVEVQITAHQPDEYPRPYQVIELNFIVKGEQIDPKAVARAIELSEQKYCVVGQSLETEVQLKTSFEVQE